MKKALILISALSLYSISCGSDDDKSKLSSNLGGSACLNLQSESTGLVLSAYWTVSECGNYGEELVYYRCDGETPVEYERVATGQYCR